MGVAYTWGLFTPSTKVEEEQTVLLRDIKKLLENQNPTDLNKFFESRGLEQKYPLGFALFYSDGRKTLYYGKPSTGGIAFDPSTLKVERKGEIYCLNIMPVSIMGRLLNNIENICMAHFAHVARINDVVLDIEPLADSSQGVAWVLGMKPAT